MIFTEGAVLFRVKPADAERSIDLAALVEAYSRTLFRVAYSILRSEAEAEDTVQDTLVRVLEHRKSLPDVRDMRPWLVKICWNLALDRRRKSQPEPMDEAFAERLAADTPDAAEQLSGRQELRAVMAAIDRLPQAERQALLLSAIEELTAAEIAAVMGKSESAVRALVFRARQRIRERTQERTEGGRR